MQSSKKPYVKPGQQGRRSRTKDSPKKHSAGPRRRRRAEWLQRKRSATESRGQKPTLSLFGARIPMGTRQKSSSKTTSTQTAAPM